MEHLLLILLGYILPSVLCIGLLCLTFFVDKNADSWGKKQDFKFFFFVSMIPFINVMLLMTLPLVIFYMLFTQSDFLDKLYQKLIDKERKKK